MFDGKIFFGVTGTPSRKMAFVKSAFADAEPVPFTFANRTTKSFTLWLLLALSGEICSTISSLFTVTVPAVTERIFFEQLIVTSSQFVADVPYPFAIQER